MDLSTLFSMVVSLGIAVFAGWVVGYGSGLRKADLTDDEVWVVTQDYPDDQELIGVYDQARKAIRAIEGNPSIYPHTTLAYVRDDLMKFSRRKAGSDYEEHFTATRCRVNTKMEV